jgi:hypothetical protein
MKRRAGIALAAGVALLLTPVSAANAAPGACPSTEIRAVDVGFLTDCATAAVIIADPNGPARIALPAPGTSVTFSATTERGAPEISQFTVYRSATGEVAARSQSSVSSVVFGKTSIVTEFTAAESVVASLATSPKCDSYSYSVNGERWLATVGWYYKTPSFGGQTRVAAAFTAMADGIGACGATKPNGAAHSYKGTTTTSSNMSGGTCLSSDLTNVVDSGAVASSTTLAQACTWRTTGQIISADIRISTAKTWYTSSSVTGCSGSKYDLQGVVTHEVGHLYGLNHVALATQQVMKPSSSTCETSQRTLGNGDLAGMKYLYP